MALFPNFATSGCNGRSSKIINCSPWFRRAMLEPYGRASPNRSAEESRAR